MGLEQGSREGQCKDAVSWWPMPERSVEPYEMQLKTNCPGG